MDPAGFRALTASVGWCALDRIVARVSGTDPVAFLHATTTQDLAGAKPGAVATTCSLDDKGRVLAEMRALIVDPETVLLDAERAASDAIFGWLARVAPLSGCEVGETEYIVVAVRGPRAATAVPVVPSASDTFESDGDMLVVEESWGVPGYDLIARAPVSVDALAVDADTFEALRIAAGRPRFGVDITQDDLINETPLLARAVSFTKGCYPGQESVARVANLGQIRRKLVGLDSAGVFAAGERVIADGAEAGVVTSAAGMPTAGAGIARVRADLEAGTTVEVGGVGAQVRALG